MYRDDSFFALGLVEAGLLLAVTGAMVWGLLLLARRLCARGGLARRLVWAAGLFWVFLWFSPQVYSLFYQLIFGGLPVQIAITWPPSPETVLRRLVFAGPATLAAHGQGVLGWALLVLAARPRLFGRVV